MYDQVICNARIVDVMGKSRFDVAQATIVGSIGVVGAVNGPSVTEVSHV